MKQVKLILTTLYSHHIILSAIDKKHFKTQLKMEKKILFALFIVILSTAFLIEASNPTGSTGCSKKWSGGYCWRFCGGSSGNWCYTSEGCTSDEERCAYVETCGNVGCAGADPGCVNDC